jgi:hypothetical protein
MWQKKAHSARYKSTNFDLKDSKSAVCVKMKRTFFYIKKHIFLTLISTFGIRQNAHSLGLVDRQFDLDILFEQT